MSEAEDWLNHLAPSNAITDTLIMGGYPDATLPAPADRIVNLTHEPHSLGKIRLNFPFHDSPTIPDGNQLVSVAHAVAIWCSQGHRVYVHCRAGLNRSGLICAIVLIVQGYSPEGAIALLRQKRDRYVLCNTHFEQWLLTRIVPSV